MNIIAASLRPSTFKKAYNEVDSWLRGLFHRECEPTPADVGCDEAGRLLADCYQPYDPLQPLLIPHTTHINPMRRAVIKRVATVTTTF